MKEQVINDILVKLSNLETAQLELIENVLINEFEDLDITQRQTLPAEMEKFRYDNQYILTLFELNRRKEGLSEKSIKQYVRSTQDMLYIVDKHITEVTSLDIKYYLQNCKRKGGQASTINNTRRFLSATYTWLRKNGIVESNPVEPVPVMPQVKKPIDYLKGAEIEQLRVACKNHRQRALLEVLLSTGMRAGEVVLVQRNDIDWEQNQMMIYGTKDREYRTVFLNAQAKYWLQQYLAERADGCPALFVNLRGQAHGLSVAGIQGIVKSIGAQSGLKRRIYTHLMRKTLASTLRQKGCNIGDISAILGHSNTAVTEGYYAVMDNENLAHTYKMFAA